LLKRYRQTEQKEKAERICCGLFNDAFSNSDYTAWSKLVIAEHGDREVYGAGL